MSETLFLLEARFCQTNNLKLAYILNVCKNASLGEVASVLKVSKTIISRILDDNIAFDTRLSAIEGWGRGGKERRIKLSSDSLQFVGTIVDLNELRFGMDECSRLRREAKKIQRGVIKREAKFERRVGDLKRLYTQGRDFDFKRGLDNLSKDIGKSKKEIMEAIVGGS